MSDEQDEQQYAFEPEPASAQAAKQSTDNKSGTGDGEDSRVELAVQVLRQMHESLGHVIELLEAGNREGHARHVSKLITEKQALKDRLDDVSGCRVVEGVFDGKCMIGSDGESYTVPPNYASKSRLVEGDVLKLTIKPDGGYIFKQIGPVDRERLTGTLAYDESASDYVVVCDQKTYKVLRASVTYFDGQPGDEVVVFVPTSQDCVWAAVENIG